MLSRFRLPGPTPLPPAVLAAMQQEMIPHRSAEFRTMYTVLLERLRTIHRTDHDVLLWPGSGSAGWEIAIANLFDPGDEVVAVITGYFGKRFAEVAEIYGLTIHRLEIPWGQAARPSELESVLAEHPQTKAVFLTHNETSTGVENPVAALAEIARSHRTLTLVDAVSSLAGLPLEIDVWDLDFVMSGSQKAWMCPPGLVVVAVGPRIWSAIEAKPRTQFFWDLVSTRAAAGEGTTPTTPPLSLIYALDAAVKMIEVEGIEAVWQRHAALGEMARSGVRELDLELFADEQFASNTVTAVRIPDDINGPELIATLKQEHGVTVAGGQGPIADTIIRIGHMGWVDDEDIDFCLNALESSLATLRSRP